jgi:hypothetical protein
MGRLNFSLAMGAWVDERERLLDIIDKLEGFQRGQNLRKIMGIPVSGEEEAATDRRLAKARAALIALR